MREPDRMVRLDDLFDDGTGVAPVDQAPAPPSRPAPPLATARWWLVHGLAALVFGTALYGVLRLAQLGVPYPLIVVTLVSIMVLRQVIGELSAASEHPLPDAVTGRGITPAPPGAAEADKRFGGLRDSVGPADGVRFAVGRWDDRFTWSERDPGRFTTLVVPRLREIADERLRQRHGVTRASDPRRAQELLGPQVWEALHVPPGRNPEPRDVASIVAQLESL